MRPVGPLAAIVGDKPIPRTEVVKKLWDYIKKHKLQDNDDKRIIRTDAKLRPLFDGQRKVTTFAMTGWVGQYLKPVKERISKPGPSVRPPGPADEDLAPTADGDELRQKVSRLLQRGAVHLDDVLLGERGPTRHWLKLESSFVPRKSGRGSYCAPEANAKHV